MNYFHKKIHLRYLTEFWIRFWHTWHLLARYLTFLIEWISLFLSAHSPIFRSRENFIGFKIGGWNNWKYMGLYIYDIYKKWHSLWPPHPFHPQKQTMDVLLKNNRIQKHVLHCDNSLSVCNFQSMKSPVERNSLFLKLFCYVTWFDETRHWRLCRRGCYVKFETIT